MKERIQSRHFAHTEVSEPDAQDDYWQGNEVGKNAYTSDDKSGKFGKTSWTKGKEDLRYFEHTEEDFEYPEKGKDDWNKGKHDFDEKGKDDGKKGKEYFD